MKKHNIPCIPFEQRLGFTPAELARALGKSRSTIYRFIYEGKLKLCKDFGSAFIPKTEVDSLLSNVSIFNPSH